MVTLEARPSGEFPMLDLGILSVLTGVGLLWLVVGFVMHRWGPGVSRRVVLCPETKSVARVSVVYKEGGFGAVQASDIVRCSLFGGGPVSCEKHCLSRV